MKEAIKNFFQTKQAKIGLAVACIAAVLAAANSWLQPTPNRNIPVANAFPPLQSTAER